VRAQLAALCGASVLRGIRLYGGYAPTATFRLFMSDGHRVVVKAVDETATSAMRRFLTDEERVYLELGSVIRPWAPAFLGSVRHDDWHALVLEDVGPARIPPWTNRLARAALRDYAAFHASTLGRADWPNWLPRNSAAKMGQIWADIAAATTEDRSIDTVARLAGPRVIEARKWLREQLPVLVATAKRIIDAPPPFALLHFDTRSDNLRIQSGGRLRLFDWPYATVGPAEFDVAAFVQSIRTEGGPAPDVALDWYAQSGLVRPDVLDASIAALAGYFADRARQPPLPGLPRVRSIQRRQLKTTLKWCATRLRLPSPDWLDAVQP
jgi:hypothetical protein